MKAHPIVVVAVLVISILMSLYGLYQTYAPVIRPPVHSLPAMADQKSQQLKTDDSTAVAASETVTGIDEAGLKAGFNTTGLVNNMEHQPELQDFDYDSDMRAKTRMQLIRPYAELSAFQQKTIRQYQNYVFDKAAHDTGISSQQFVMLKRGLLKSQQTGQTEILYQFNTGRYCEIHQVTIHAESGDYDERYGYC